MPQKLKHLLNTATVALTAAALTAGCAASNSADTSTKASPGITDTSISLGDSAPLSGPAAALGGAGKAVEAYFKYVNDQGGVKMGDGKTRKIDFKLLDDAYTPARALGNAKQLVSQDNVFSLVGTEGSATNAAMADYLNQQKVPQAFALSSSARWGDYKTYPWTIGWQPTAHGIGVAFGSYIKQNYPKGKIAVLYQNDDFGKTFLSATKSVLQGTSVQFVAEQSYDVTAASVTSQVTALAHSGADIFLDYSIGRPAVQAITTAAQLNWKPVHIIDDGAASAATFQAAGVAASEGIISAGFIKDPASPQWANDPAVQKFKQLVAKYGPDLDANDVLVAEGWGIAETFVKVLEDTKKPTRQALMDALRSMNGVRTDLMLPDLALKTTSTDAYPLEQVSLVRIRQGHTEQFGDLLKAPGNG